MDNVPVHNVKLIRGIEVLNTSIGMGWNGIFACTAKIRPSNYSLPGVPSLLVKMVTFGSLQGEWKVRGEIKEVTLVPGDFAIIPANQALEANIISDAEVINIYINNSILHEIGYRLYLDSDRNNSALNSILYSVPVKDGLIEEISYRIKDNLENGGKYSAIEAEYFSRAIVVQIISRYSYQGTAALCESWNGSFNNAIEYIDKNIKNKMITSNISKHVGVSTEKIARLFKKNTGKTLHQYIIERRVDRARYLLSKTNMPIADIAHECGFSDQVHLTRYFGRIVGASPALFRRNNKLG